MRGRMILILTLGAALLAGCGGDDDVRVGLSIVVDHPDRDAIEYRVTCTDDTGTVSPDDVGIDAAAACLALEDPVVVTRLVDGPPADLICAEIFGGQDTAVITGSIDDEAVDASIDRVNACSIFDWDDLLAAVLPPALGF